MAFKEQYIKSYKEYIESLDLLERIENEVIEKALKKGRNDIIDAIKAERILRESLPH